MVYLVGRLEAVELVQELEPRPIYIYMYIYIHTYTYINKSIYI